MPDIAGATQLLATVPPHQGPGTLLRVVLLVAVVGAALLAWFVLRGYRNQD